MNFNFIAGNILDLGNFLDIGKFVDTYPDFQTLTLNNENELKILLKLMGIDEFYDHELIDSEFSKYWNLSTSKLPELSKDQFDQFYRNWIIK